MIAVAKHRPTKYGTIGGRTGRDKRSRLQLPPVNSSFTEKLARRPSGRFTEVASFFSA